jgi:uncharacterized protein YyaL (SSP411 family)
LQTSETSRIQWLDWGPEAFKKAVTESKPILLAISAVWCHWCHVQDKTTYSDPEVVRIVNREYVPIRVDNDKRPDINRRYNMGGWPTTAFLSPDGEVIAGGTYIPPEEMKDALRKVRSLYLQEKAKAPSTAPLGAEPQRREMAGISQGIVDDVLTSVVMSFDSTYGGFGDGPKFPQTDALELALAQYWYSGDKGLLTIVTKTLDHMAEGGMYDHEDGGFFRYSTNRDWTIPHYEKMCEDNAKLLTIYLHAYQVTGRDSYRQVASQIIQYVNITLADQERGGFSGSQDADEVYYKLTRAERAKAKAPRVDETIYTNWNGLMISAYLEGAATLNDESLREHALRSIQRLLNEAYNSQHNAMYHYISGGTRHLKGLLTDQTSFGKALIDAYQSTGDTQYLSHAERLVRCLDEGLLDSKNGGYYDSPPRPDSLGYLKRLDKPLDENSALSMVLTRLHHATNDETYFEKAKSTLDALAAIYGGYGYAASTYALATDLLLNQPTRVVVVGARKESATRQLHETSLRAYDPRKLVIPVDPDTDTERLHRLGYSTDAEPRAYICFGRTCLPPVTDPAEITRQLLALAKH